MNYYILNKVENYTTIQVECERRLEAVILRPRKGCEY